MPHYSQPTHIVTRNRNAPVKEYSQYNTSWPVIKFPVGSDYTCWKGKQSQMD